MQEYLFSCHFWKLIKDYLLGMRKKFIRSLDIQWNNSPQQNLSSVKFVIAELYKHTIYMEYLSKSQKKAFDSHIDTGMRSPDHSFL